MRLACLNYADTQFSNKIGDVGKVVEIDESVMAKRKYNRGRVLKEVWIFGGICREDKQLFLIIVPDRTSVTLLKAIKDHILPGTTIYSDCWAAYNKLLQEGYPHLTVNHSENFIDPSTGAHTQTIERLWRSVKTVAKQRNGILTNRILEYLAEFIWFRDHPLGPDRFEDALQLLKDTDFSFGDNSVATDEANAECEDAEETVDRFLEEEYTHGNESDSEENDNSFALESMRNRTMYFE